MAQTCPGCIARQQLADCAHHRQHTLTEPKRACRLCAPTLTLGKFQLLMMDEELADASDLEESQSEYDETAGDDIDLTLELQLAQLAY